MSYAAPLDWPSCKKQILEDLVKGTRLQSIREGAVKVFAADKLPGAEVQQLGEAKVTRDATASRYKTYTLLVVFTCASYAELEPLALSIENLWERGNAASVTRFNRLAAMGVGDIEVSPITLPPNPAEKLPEYSASLKITAVHRELVR